MSEFAKRMQELAAESGEKLVQPMAVIPGEAGQTANPPAEPETPEPTKAEAAAPAAEPAKGEPTKSEGAGEPAKPEAAAAPEVDLSSLPPAIRERLEHAAKVEADLRTYQGRAGALQRELNKRERELATFRQSGVQSGHPTQAPPSAPAAPVHSTSAPAMPPATQQSVATEVFSSNQWTSLKREYPEFAVLEQAFGLQEQQIARLRESAIASHSSPDLINRLAALETQIRETTERQEQARWNQFDRTYQPQKHVIVTVDDYGTATAFKNMSPQFATVWNDLSDDERAALDWNDPDSLAPVFDRVRALSQTPATPAAAPTMAPARDPAALAGAAAPTLRTQTVARVPSGPGMPFDFQARMREKIAEYGG